MTRAKEMRDLPLAIDATASGNVGKNYISSSIIKARYLVYDGSNGNSGNGHIGDKVELISDGTYWHVDAIAYGKELTVNQQPVWSGSSS